MLRSAIRRLLNLDDPPERTAMAFAIGTFIGLSPFLGLHTILAASVSVVWRLNKLAVLTGSFLSNPWTIAPIVGASWALGRLIIGSPPVELPQANLSALFTAEFWSLLAAQWRQLLPFAVGSMILSIVSAAISYPLILYILRNYRRANLRVASRD
jgi:uncharacterized protein